MNELEKRYAQLDDIQLLKVLQNREKYHPEAIIAVEKELASRSLSEAELAVVTDHFAQQQSAQDEREAKKQRLNRSATDRIKAFVDTINPIKKVPYGTEKTSNLLLIGFSLIATYELFRQINYLSFLGSIPISRWDFTDILSLTATLLLLGGYLPILAACFLRLDGICVFCCAKHNRTCLRICHRLDYP